MFGMILRGLGEVFWSCLKDCWGGFGDMFGRLFGSVGGLVEGFTRNQDNDERPMKYIIHTAIYQNDKEKHVFVGGDVRSH